MKGVKKCLDEKGRVEDVKARAVGAGREGVTVWNEIFKEGEKISISRISAFVPSAVLRFCISVGFPALRSVVPNVISRW
jgi:hypothetical protein